MKYGSQEPFTGGIVYDPLYMGQFASVVVIAVVFVVFNHTVVVDTAVVVVIFGSEEPKFSTCLTNWVNCAIKFFKESKIIVHMLVEVPPPLICAETQNMAEVKTRINVAAETNDYYLHL